MQKLRISTRNQSKHLNEILKLIRVILQRQFFEAVARSAAVKYANRSDLPTLADKLDYLIKNKLIPMSNKNKSKTPDDDVTY